VARAIHTALIVVMLATLGGCAAAGLGVQRATEGPTADELFLARFIKGYGRPPTFHETVAWREQFDARIAEYVTRQPGMLASTRVTQFRVERRVAVGMSKEEVTLLAGLPEAVVADAKTMEAAAKQFWPEVRKSAKEMWSYPGGWQFYFDEDRLVDLTVTGRQPLE
jgi:hypothetical protein